MKALPFPCIRPAQDRVLEALPAMGSILSGNDALGGAIADGLMLKDPGAAYYVYECSGEPGRVTGVVAICPTSVLAGGKGDASADVAAAARAIAELKVQPRPVSLVYEASPVMDIILGAAKEGASLYAVTDPAGITHRAWEVKREDAVGAIRAMLDQAPEPALADNPAYAAALIQNDITVACYSLAQAHALSEAAVAAGGRVHIHLKADTGMGRIGFALRTDFDAAIREMLEACALPGLEMTGLFQHFSVADDTAPENVAYTAEQHALFVKAFHALKAAGREPALVHCDNSAGVMLHPDWPEGLPRERCMARPGIILYGYDPSDEVRFGRFKPVMTLKTVVSMIKEMQPGQCASYGRRFTAEKPTKVATLCTGYADGYPRLLSCGKGVVEIHGKACPVLGRVCMDQMMVDVTDVPDVREDDEAILWGGTVSDTAETIARKTDTIPYEVLCGVSRRVPRVYRDHGQIVAVEDWILEA